MENPSQENIFQEIEDVIKNNDIVLFMKGSAVAPQCGFSALVVQVLKTMNVPFKDMNVLLNDDLRQNIKSYSNWPTIPQLYIKGEFIGGCDIVKEMYQAGELQELLKSKGII
jgi:monothiol glutaredoxin